METSQLRFIDTHCHLYVPEFEKDRIEMISRAVEGGIFQMMLPNIDFNSINEMLRLSNQFKDKCFPMLGLHPCSVDKTYEEVLLHMKETFQNEAFIGIGETGIDLYWETGNK